MKRWAQRALLGVVACFLASTVAGLPVRAQVGPQSVAGVAERLFDSVVNISTTQTLKGPQGIPLPKVPQGSPFEEFFKDFFNRKGGEGAMPQASSLGSGFVVDPSGLIATNNHVIADGDEIYVSFNDGTRLKVEKVVGRDTTTDIALLQVKPTHPLSAVRPGDSSKLRVGDWVMAIGNPFNLGGTLTVGVISAKNRNINSGPYDEFLQTDAAINKGNSGGPLFNMDGELVGINTAIISPTGGSIGLGFAIPSNVAMGVIDQLRQFGETRRGWIGVSIQSLSEEIGESLALPGAKGALISQVAAGGPAERAGIKVGDVVIGFDGQAVADMRALPRIVALTPIGKSVEVEVVRNGQHLKLTVQVDKLVEEVKSADPGAGTEPPPGEDPPVTTPDFSVPLGEVSLLGLTLQELTPELRGRLAIADKVEGLAVVGIDAQSPAAGKGIREGEVIVEATNERLATPADLAKRIEALKAQGRTSVLLLVSDAAGDIRFVAVPLDGPAPQ